MLCSGLAAFANQAPLKLALAVFNNCSATTDRAFTLAHRKPDLACRQACISFADLA
ncbi:MAG: hypothetical protein ACI9PZ_002284 [Parvicella sp.]|jgi:hypothetical protein